MKKILLLLLVVILSFPSLKADAITVNANPVNKLHTEYPEIHLDHPCKGKEALGLLDHSKILELAKHFRYSEERFCEILRDDPSMWLDKEGHVFVKESIDPINHEHTHEYTAVADGEDLVLSDLNIALEDTFKLHSLPGSNRVIYLDFDGYIIPETSAWARNGEAIDAPAFDKNGDPNSFSNGELRDIQKIWQIVAEDFAAFDVDVTTEDPGYEAINRENTLDEVYGTTVLISPISSYFGNYGGLAYLGVFDRTGTWGDRYKPALVFPEKLAKRVKYIAEACSHEAGHNLGLSHDGGNPGGTYYRGHGSWAPIMGNSYYKNITHWSKGEYSSANNTQDDYQLMASNGLFERADDHANDFNSATDLLINDLGSVADKGVISSPTDIDIFKFTTGGGLVELDFLNVDLYPNLDIELSLYDAAEQLIQTFNPNSLSASISANLDPGLYYVAVDGVGTGDPNTGYSDYSSLGFYEISGTIPAESFVNQAPVAVDDQKVIYVNPDAENVIGIIAPLENDSDPNGDSFEILSVTDPSGQAKEITFEPRYIYYHVDIGFYGNTQLKYKTIDSRGLESNEATINVEIRPLFNPPIAVDDTVNVLTAQSITIEPLANDSDPDGDEFTITNYEYFGLNSLVLNPDNKTFTYASLVPGTDVFTYTVTDTTGRSATAEVQINITAANQVPQANNDTFSINVSSSPEDFTLLEPLFNDFDDDGDDLTIISYEYFGLNGLTLNPDNKTFNYVSLLPGTDVFTYTISDGKGGTATAEASIEIAALPNASPVAVDDNYNPVIGQPTVLRPLDNDFDPDGDDLIIQEFFYSGFNEVSLSEDKKTLNFTAFSSNIDVVNYIVSDGKGGTDFGTINLLPIAVNNNPIAVADTVTVSTGEIATIEPLINDSDPDGDDLTITSYEYFGLNNLVLNPDNKTFTYSSLIAGNDILTYTVSDGKGGTATAEVSISITVANQVPQANDDTFSINVSSSPEDFTLLEPLFNDFDDDGDDLTITSYEYFGLNSLNLNPDNKTFTYSSLIAGNDIFTYTVSDGKGGTAIAEVSISIQQASSNPTVRLDDRSPNVPEGSPVGTLIGTFIIEDADLPNDTHTITLEEMPSDLGPDGTPISTYFKIENSQLLVAKTLPRLSEVRGSIYLRYEVEDSSGNTASSFAFVYLIDDDQDDEFDINEASSFFNVDIDKDLISSGNIRSVSELYAYTQEGKDLNTIPEAISFENLVTNLSSKKDLSIFKIVSKKNAEDPGSPAYENFDFEIVTRMSNALLSELKDIVFYDLNPQYNFEVNSVGYTYNSLVKYSTGESPSVSSVSSVSRAFSSVRFTGEPTYINQTASEIEIDFPYEDKIRLNNSETADIAKGRFKIKFDRATLKDEFTRAYVERGGSQGSPQDILLLDGNYIEENNQVGDFISRLYAPEDKDIFDQIVFELVPSENSSKFLIDGNLLLANTSFDFEEYVGAETSETITVKATDSVGNEYLKDLSIQILDLDDQPEFEPITIGETGSLEVPFLGSSKAAKNIKTVYFKDSYENPVVILNHNSNSDSDPAIAVVRNLRENAFDLELQEWLYQDGVRSYNGSNPAVIEYMVFEAGEYELDDGTKIEAGFVNATKDFSTHNFNTSFTIVPTMFTQVVADDNSEKSVVERLRDDNSNTSFSVLIEAEEKQSLSSQSNQIGYVAIEDSNSNFFNLANLQLKHVPQKVAITENEVFISRMQSYFGPDTANLRAYRLNQSSIDVFVQEEQSRDSEMRHTFEFVTYTKLPRNHVIKIQSDTSNQTYLSSEAATTNIAVQLANNFSVYLVDPLKDFITNNFNLTMLSGNEFASVTPDKKIELNAISLKDSNLTGDLISYEIEDIASASKSEAKLSIGTQAENLDDIAEIASIQLKQNSKDTWTTVNLSKTFVDPVVIISPVTFRGRDPSVVRVRNINSNSFEFQVDEWDYKDGRHTRETVNYLVIEKGIHELNDGTVFEAGDLTVSHEAHTQVLNYPNYNLAINADPIILSQVSSVNEESAVTTRICNITDKSFKILLSEQEANDGIHAAEKVGYLAIYKNPLWFVEDSNTRFGNTGVIVNHNLFDINYNALNSVPKCFAQIQSYSGVDTSALRFKSTTQTSLTLFVEEEKSSDSEIEHILEDVGFYCSSEDGLIQGDTF